MLNITESIVDPNDIGDITKIEINRNNKWI